MVRSIMIGLCLSVFVFGLPMAGVVSAVPQEAGEKSAAQKKAKKKRVKKKKRKKKKKKQSSGRFDDHDQLLRLRKPVTYIPSKSGRGRQKLSFSFDVLQGLPNGSKLNFELLFRGLAVDDTNFVLKDPRRKALTMEWSPKKRLAVTINKDTDAYILRVRLYPDKQTKAVQSKLKGMSKSLPAKYAPWSWLLHDYPILVGTAEERRQELAAACRAYERFVEDLHESYTSIKDKLAEIEAGELAADGDGELDYEEFKDIIVTWRKDQGELQKKIQELPLKNSGIVQKSAEAYGHLRDLGVMISKFGKRREEEVAKGYNVEPVKLKKPVHASFNARYQFVVGQQELELKVNELLDLICPPEPEPAEDEKKKGSGKKKPKRKKKRK